MADGTHEIIPALEPPSIVVSGEAITIGGNAGGRWLDKLGKFDLRQLTPDEYKTYCTIVVFYALHSATNAALDNFMKRLERVGPISSDEIPF